MRRVLPLVFLVGCVDKHGGDSTAGDSANDPPCELSHPWAMDSAEHVGVAGALAYPNVAAVLLLDIDAVSAARNAVGDGDSCPTLTESDDGTAVTISGDCTTTWGLTYGGTATFISQDSPYSYSATYDQFHFNEREYSGRYGYDVDGAWSYVDEDGISYSWDLTLTMLGDWVGAGPDIQVTYSTTGDSDGLTEGYADIAGRPDGEPIGDLCLVDSWQYVDSCDSEGDELVSLWGTTPATLTWDGSTNCDGCADVTIDGVDAGSYCP